MDFTELIFYAYIISYIVIFLRGVTKPDDEEDQSVLWLVALIGAGYACIPVAILLAILINLIS